jgi:protoporphyrinogen oxidase
VRGLEVEVAPDGRRVARGVRLADGEVVAADAVVCAVPVWDMADLLKGLPEAEAVQRVVAELTPVPIVSVNLYLDRDLGMADWGEVIHGGEGVLEQLWDRQRMHGRTPNPSWLFSTTVSAAYELVGMRNDEIVEAQMAVLAQRYPSAVEARVVHAHVVRMARSTFAQRPGTAGLRPSQATSVEGLVLAGDWTRTDWTTTMEGACQSAARAVAVLEGGSVDRRFAGR